MVRVRGLPHRSVGGYVAWLLIRDLKQRRGAGQRRRARGVSVTDKRRAFEVAVSLTAEQKGKVEDRARDEVSSFSEGDEIILKQMISEMLGASE